MRRRAYLAVLAGLLGLARHLGLGPWRIRPDHNSQRRLGPRLVGHGNRRHLALESGALVSKLMVDRLPDCYFFSGIPTIASCLSYSICIV